jgi:hypothetical protein
MPDSSSKPKRTRDLNQAAADIVEAATEGEPEIEEKRDAAAVALGRKGGKARADKLTAEQRREIAKKAAAVRGGSRG